jgi:SSS family solute:Na+ symporter
MTLISDLIFVGTSLVTAKPSRRQVAALTWSRAFWRRESDQLRNLPWYRNHRCQSAGLLVIALIIVLAGGNRR